MPESGYESRSSERHEPKHLQELALQGRSFQRVSLPGYRRRPAARESLIITGPLVEDAASRAFRPGSRPEIVVGDDDRAAVPDSSVTPWSKICALRITCADGVQCVGTGWLIGPRTVMTAGHCVCVHEHGGWVRSITVVPGLSGADEPYKRQTSSVFRATAGWTDRADTNFDYGAILLDEPLWESAVGWFSFAAMSDSQLRAQVANICGYPFDRDQARRQYFHARRILQLSPQRLFYDIDTYGGQSGSPIWLDDGERWVAIGVHTSGSSSGNSGTRITREVFETMQEWKGGFELPDTAAQQTLKPKKQAKQSGAKVRS